MSEEKRGIEINPDELIEKLTAIQAELDCDLARIIEYLLLENHVLNVGQSSGYRRGVDLDFSKFPRFLQLIEND